MKWKVKCQKCGQSLELGEDNLEHRRGVCPSCDAIFYVSDLLEQAGYDPSTILSHATQNTKNHKKQNNYVPPPRDSKDKTYQRYPENERSLFIRLIDYRTLIKWLDSGKVIKVAAGTMLQTLTVIQAVWFVCLWFLLWIALKDVKFLEGITIIIWQFGSLYAAYMIFRVQFYRASQIKELPDSEYVITPIIGIFLTIAGEVWFIFFLIMSIPLALMTALGGMYGGMYGPETILGWLPFSRGWLPAIGVFIGCISSAFLGLIIFRWLREWLLVLMSMAGDVNIIKSQLLSKEKEINK